MQKESDFTKQVLQLAKLYRWHTAHFRPAMTKQGWRTPVQGDGKGFPDLMLVRERLIAVELKSEKGKLSEEQTVWLGKLRAAGIDCYLWRPTDWPEIQAVLTRPLKPSETGRTEDGLDPDFASGTSGE